ncbi:MAG TPA: hypothetical protein VLS27_04445 [Gammaproteobacteria bacterium]|nr:hypothetical protein [Gammaproteobacteria bacterium]
MDAIQCGEKIRFLIDRWCERRELQPLRRLLNGQASINGLTDGWIEIRDELRTIRAQDKAVLRNDEMKVVAELIQDIEQDVLKR